MYGRFPFGCVIRILIWLRNGIVPRTWDPEGPGARTLPSSGGRESNGPLGRGNVMFPAGVAPSHLSLSLGLSLSLSFAVEAGGWVVTPRWRVGSGAILPSTVLAGTLLSSSSPVCVVCLVSHLYLPIPRRAKQGLGVVVGSDGRRCPMPADSTKPSGWRGGRW